VKIKIGDKLSLVMRGFTQRTAAFFTGIERKFVAA